MKHALLSLALLAVAVAGCRCERRASTSAAKQGAAELRPAPAPPDVHAHARDGVLVVRSFEVKDVSATGARLDAAVELLKKAIDEAGDDEVRLREHKESPLALDLEVANLCERGGCYVAVKARARLRGDEGLEQVFSAVRVSPIDGLEAGPPMRSAGPAALGAVRQWLEALTLPAGEIAPLLRGEDLGQVQVALQVVLDRGLGELAEDVAALIEHTDKEVRVQAIATAAAVDGDKIVPALAKAARSLEPEVAEAAVRALADVGGEAAGAALGELAADAPLATIRDLARELVGP